MTFNPGPDLDRRVPRTDPDAPDVPLLPRLWLCAYLLAWVPLDYAAEATRALPSIGLRGVPAVFELLTHGLIGALSAAAGWMLWTRHPAAPDFASAAVLGASAMAVQSLYWSALPHDVPPGTSLPLALLAIVHGGVWFVYLRVRGRLITRR